MKGEMMAEVYGDKGKRLGTCPECGSIDVWCAHETAFRDELSKWVECNSCGHRYIEVFRRIGTERWEDRK